MNNVVKNLVIASTSVIILFTYLVGLGIAFVTEQINLNNIFSMIYLVLVSLVIFSACVFFFFKSLFHIRNIPKILRDLD